MSCGIGRRQDSDPEFLWLWRRPEATAPIWPLAWEPPYASAAALKRKKEKTILDRSNSELLFEFVEVTTSSLVLLIISI